jgi:hypothetical protein
MTLRWKQPVENLYAGFDIACFDWFKFVLVLNVAALFASIEFCYKDCLFILNL